MPRNHKIMAKKTGNNNNNNNNNNNKNDDNNDDTTRYEFSLPLHETLGWALFTWRRSLTNLGEKLLSAYASQKYSMARNDGVFYTTSSKLINPSLTTDKRLSNMVIITFEAIFIKASSNNDCLIYERPEKMLKEKEYRRYVDDSHPLLIQKLGGHGCNDLSNMKFHSREIHIYFNDYRLMINVKDDTFYIQYKKFIEKKECFLVPTLTREILYTSDEGPAYTEPRFIVSQRGKTIIGVASFLDCRNFCVKTVYAQYKESICLYQRVQPDNFSQSYPFVLECELDYDDDNDINDEEKKLILYKFFDIGCQLDATVSKRKNHHYGGCDDNNNNDGLLNHSLAVSSKPVHKATIPRRKNGGGFFFPKFDGVPATLIFFPHHFVIRNAIKSDSFEHSLPRKIYYILKDYKFLVESDLYVSKYKKEENLCLNRPNPLVIIDIQTTAFTAEKRMSIIQILRNCLAKFLYEYFIFFQGEDCDGVLTTATTPKAAAAAAAVVMSDGGKEDEEEEEDKDKDDEDDYDGEEKEKEELNIIQKKKKRDNRGKKIIKRDDLSLLLSKGVIYEVKLSLDNKRIINKVIKPRRDKFKANSSKMVDLIWKIQTTQTQLW